MRGELHSRHAGRTRQDTAKYLTQPATRPRLYAAEDTILNDTNTAIRESLCKIVSTAAVSCLVGRIGSGIVATAWRTRKPFKSIISLSIIFPTYTTLHTKFMMMFCEWKSNIYYISRSFIYIKCNFHILFIYLIFFFPFSHFNLKHISYEENAV